jgi:hypothetical protein
MKGRTTVIKAVFLCAMAVLPGMLSAQALPTTTPPPPERITKVIRLHYGDPSKIAFIVSHNAPVTADSDSTLRAVILKGAERDITQAEQTIKALDQPAEPSASGKDVELTVYIIGATDKVNSSPVGNDLADVASVVKQLRSIFPYKEYRLFGTMLLRSQQGKQASNKGLINLDFVTDQPSEYSVMYESAKASTEGSKTVIHLDDFQANAQIMIKTSPTQIRQFFVGTRSNIDIREGQKVVVGKANVAGANSALFIVLSAKVAE